MRYNPEPERTLDWSLLERYGNVAEGKRLYHTLLKGEIPDFKPSRDFVTFSTRHIVTAFRMWAFIHKEFCHIASMALENYFGPNAVYLEIMAGVGWLAKGLSEAGLSGEYIATDLKPPEDAVHPIIQMDAVSAIKNFSHVDCYVVSWPPYDDPIIEACVAAMPPQAKIFFIGEWAYGCTGTRHFFKMIKDITPGNKLWQDVRSAFYCWDGIHDWPYLVQKRKKIKD